METLKTQQILIPKKVYIGDTAELRLTFSCEQDLTEYSFVQGLDYKTYTVNNIELSKTGLNFYQISINFVPWKTGNIQFPDFVLYSNVQKQISDGAEAEKKSETKQNIAENTDVAAKKTEATDEYLINLDPVNIVSLVEQNQIVGLRASKAPMLIPGTTYIIWGTIIGIVLVTLIGIRLLVKHKQIAQFIKERKLLHKYRKNKKKTIKALNLLVKNVDSLQSDSDFISTISAKIQNIMREYLEIRFEYPFTKATTSEILPGFIKTTCELASDEKMAAAEQISGIFIRTDYLRYKKDATLENPKEFIQIAETLKEQIEILEFIPPKNMTLETEPNTDAKTENIQEKSIQSENQEEK